MFEGRYSGEIFYNLLLIELDRLDSNGYSYGVLLLCYCAHLLVMFYHVIVSSHRDPLSEKMDLMR